jgi:hypothetical protein
VATAILVLNIYHKGQHGIPASDFLIATAATMAKMTFTTLKDPTGRFAIREELIINAITFQDDDDDEQVRYLDTTSLHI